MKLRKNHDRLSALESGSTHEVEVGSERSFGAVFTVVFTAIAFWPMLEGGQPRVWAGSGAVFLALISIIRPSLLKPCNILWAKIGLLLGRFVSPIVMVFVFIIAVIPIGLIMRMMGKDILNIKKPATSISSYWLLREVEDKEKTNMKNQF